MKTLIAIMAHAAAEDTVKRHLPYWREHEKEGATLMFFSPADAGVHVEGYQCMQVCKAAHDGPEAIKRFRTIIEFLASAPGYDRVAFLEYDSLILGPLPRLNSDIAGNIFFDNGTSFVGKSFIHPPWITDGDAISKIAAEIAKMPFTIEASMWDRMLGLASERAKLLRTSWISNGYGYSQNTIHPAHYSSLREAILKGAHALHGVKDMGALHVIKETWEERRHVDYLESKGWKICRA